MTESTMKLTQRFTGCASLAALGIKLRTLDLLAPIRKLVQIPQKTVKDTPFEKLSDAFISILAGATGLVEINSRLRSDRALQHAFGRTRCAEQSVDGLPEHLAGQVPQSQVDRRQHPVRQRAQVQPLAFLERVPDALPIEGVLARQHRGDDLLDRGGAHAAEIVPAGAVVGRDRQHRLHRVLLGARVPVAV